MIKTALAVRLKATGVTQAQLAARLGYARPSVNEALKNGSATYEAIISALEIMGEHERKKWLTGE
jgi:transcriptional regulator with XRE-family HTH domain